MEVGLVALDPFLIVPIHDDPGDVSTTGPHFDMLHTARGDYFPLAVLDHLRHLEPRVEPMMEIGSAGLFPLGLGGLLTFDATRDTGPFLSVHLPLEAAHVGPPPEFNTRHAVRRAFAGVLAVWGPGEAEGSVRGSEDHNWVDRIADLMGPLAPIVFGGPPTRRAWGARRTGDRPIEVRLGPAGLSYTDKINEWRNPPP